jgi:hypothetical protein
VGNSSNAAQGDLGPSLQAVEVCILRGATLNFFWRAQGLAPAKGLWGDSVGQWRRRRGSWIPALGERALWERALREGVRRPLRLALGLMVDNHAPLAAFGRRAREKPRSSFLPSSDSPRVREAPRRHSKPRTIPVRDPAPDSTPTRQ